jgi:uncharacterized protein (TIGR02594 family)
LFNFFKKAQPAELPWITEGKKVFGLHEIRNNAALKQWLRSDGKTLGDPKALPWCFTGETEVLTIEGWQRLDSITANKVCQVDDNNIVSLTDYKKIEKPYNDIAYAINSRHITVVADKNHKWWGSFRRGSSLELNTLDKINSDGLLIPPISAPCVITPIDNNLLHFIAAFISDGFIHRNKIEFQVSKQRKIDSLRSLNPSHEYRANKTYGISKEPLTTFTFNEPINFSSYFTDYKKLSWDFIFKLSKQNCRDFLKFYSMYDGSTRFDGRITLYTSEPHIRDMLLTVITLAGYMPNIEKGGKSVLTVKKSYRIGYVPKSSNRRLHKKHITEIPYEGSMYCVSVPTGKIIVRGKNLLPVVTGNCGDYVETAIKNSLPNEPFTGALGQNPYWARNWAHFGVETEPVYGSIVVLTRGSGGHVGFLVGVDASSVYLLGGNQGNTVNISRMDKARVIAYRWPSTYVKQNKPAPIMSPSSVPSSTNEF